MLPAHRIPDLDEPLSDGVITLRLEQERDIPEVLCAHDDDPLLYRARGLQRPPSGADLGRGIEQAAARRAAGVDETLTILGPPDDAFAGQLVVHSIEWQDRRADVGLWLRPGARGQGIGRRALVLAARWLFGVWELERLGLGTRPDNAAMIACAQAAGFRAEGVLRGHRLIGGQREDEAVFSLLAGELAPSGRLSGPATGAP